MAIQDENVGFQSTCRQACHWQVIAGHNTYNSMCTEGKRRRRPVVQAFATFVAHVE